MKINMLSLKSSHLIHTVTLALLLFYNFALFRNFFNVYTPSLINIGYGFSLALIIFSLTEILFNLFCFRFTTKPVLILILLVSSVTSYFMNNYNIVIDAAMIQNTLQTNTAEAKDLLSLKLVIYLLLLGVLPSLYVYKIKLQPATVKQELISRFKIILVAMLIIVSQMVLFGKFYSSFFREHKELRYYANPIIYLYSTAKFIDGKFATEKSKITEVGRDANIPKSDVERELVILVVGETARSDHFSLNGYQKKTNPLLEKENVYSFNNFRACGTSTAISVPCMFSHLKIDGFNEANAHNSENLLDVLQHAGVSILWRDNNSDSKHVALRVPYEDFKNPEKNPLCDPECRDVGMLHGLQDYIDSKKTGDILIVLHQMGNHGPAYYKRYPKKFEKFTPACQTNQLEECSLEEIGNAYDNAILYTDYFLSEVIRLLKKYDKKFETTMVYISDHGESLGEGGVFLHGMPNFMAPENQKIVGAMFWFGDSYDDIDKAALTRNKTKLYAHDNLFHTMLGIFEINADVYDKTMDILDHID